MALTVPIIFAELPPGPVPMSYFDENFAFVLANLNGVLAQFFQTLPTVPPALPGALWKNGNAQDGYVICITPGP